ncbi:MAG: hypothetical protein ACI84O_000018 [Myxococcota bacterium]|jgi:hypothetical protein
MKFILKLSAAASCSLIAVMQTNVTQQVTTAALTAPKLRTDVLPAAATSVAVAPYLRIAYSAESVLAVETDNVFIGEQSFDIGELRLDVLITFERDHFHFKYTATNTSGQPIYWAGSEKNCGLMYYHATVVGEDSEMLIGQNNIAPQYGRIKIEDAQRMLMVAGEQRIINVSVAEDYFSDIRRDQISSLRWWSVVPLASISPIEMQHAFGDLYGSWSDRGKFKLEFQAPFWNNASSVAKFKTALRNKVKLGEHREIIGGLQIDSELHYDSGDIIEKITVTNISDGVLYWPRSIDSSESYAPIDFTLVYANELSWDIEECSSSMSFGCGGVFIDRHSRSKPTAADLDRWFMQADEVFEYQSRTKFDPVDFREMIYLHGRGAIRGVDHIRGARHTIREALNYPPEVFPSSPKWKRKSFRASFAKDEGYSHILYE